MKSKKLLNLKQRWKKVLQWVKKQVNQLKQEQRNIANKEREDFKAKYGAYPDEVVQDITNPLNTIINAVAPVGTQISAKVPMGLWHNS